jgi:hypothetical protein
MIDSGWVLYLLGLLFVLLFIFKFRGFTFEELLERSALEHDSVKRIHMKHPHGGTWHEFKQWMNEELKAQETKTK